ncbi:MAG: hypothetical protein PHH14_00475 [Candidatus Margulisbacteria bacterium]|nr:hypothetical protein [Candidatus Margulisiibacteriota bacterium]
MTSISSLIPIPFNIKPPDRTSKEAICAASTTPTDADLNALLVYYDILIASISIDLASEKMSAGYTASARADVDKLDLDQFDFNADGIVDGGEEWNANYMYPPFYQRLEAALTPAFREQFKQVIGNVQYGQLDLKGKIKLMGDIKVLLAGVPEGADKKILQSFVDILIASISLDLASEKMTAGYTASARADADKLDLDQFDFNADGIVDGGEEWNANYMYPPFYQRLEEALTPAFREQFKQVIGNVQYNDPASFTTQAKIELAEKIANMYSKLKKSDFCAPPPVIAPPIVAPPPPAPEPTFLDRSHLRVNGSYKHMSDSATESERSFTEQWDPDMTFDFGIDGYRPYNGKDLSVILSGDTQLNYNSSGNRNGHLSFKPGILFRAFDWLEFGPVFGYEYTNSDSSIPGGPYGYSGREHLLSAEALIKLYLFNNKVTFDLSGGYGLVHRAAFADNYGGVGYAEKTARWMTGSRLNINLPGMTGNDWLPKIENNFNYYNQDTLLPQEYSNGLEANRFYQESDRNVSIYKISAPFKPKALGGWTIAPQFEYRRESYTGVGRENKVNGRAPGMKITAPYFNDLFSLEGSYGMVNQRPVARGMLTIDFWAPLRSKQQVTYTRSFPAAVAKEQAPTAKEDKQAAEFKEANARISAQTATPEQLLKFLLKHKNANPKTTEYYNFILREIQPHIAELDRKKIEELRDILADYILNEQIDYVADFIKKVNELYPKNAAAEDVTPTADEKTEEKKDLLPIDDKTGSKLTDPKLPDNELIENMPEADAPIEEVPVTK